MFGKLEHSLVNSRFCKLCFNSFCCLCTTLILVAVSLEPALLQISAADVAQQVAKQSGRLKMV